MFKYFNPLWIINNFLQPSLGPEILVPAAIGAVGSAAMGKNPVTGALLGGATGGILGGAGGAGGNLFSGFKSALPSATGTGIQLGSTAVNPSLALNAVDDVALQNAFNTSLPTNLIGGAGQGINISPYLNVADDGLGFAASGAPATGIPFSFSSAPNPLTIDPRRMVVDTPLNFGERISDFGSNVIPSTVSYAQQNPMMVLGGGQSLLNIRQQNEMANQQRLRNAVASAPPIRQGQSGPMAGNLLQVRRIG
jgi:hypothetical protein